MSSLPSQIPAEPVLSLDPLTPPEPELIRRERVLLHEILRLVAERAAAEQKVESARVSNDTKADAEYEKTRQSLTSKFEKLTHEAVGADEQGRRTIVETATKNEALAKSEFSSSSRKIATEFDTLRETAKSEYQRDKSATDSAYNIAVKKAAKEHSEETKAINEAAGNGDALRERLGDLAAKFPKFKLNPDQPEPAPENYSKYDDPLFEVIERHTKMEAPLTLVEGLVIPKMTNGLNEIWIYLFTIAALVVPAAMPGIVSGMITVENTRSGPAPRSCAASMTALSSFSTLP